MTRPRMGRVGLLSPLLRQADRLLYALDVFQGVFVLVLPRPTAGDEEDAEEGQEAAADEFSSLFGSRTFEIPVQHGAADDDTERERDKLDRDNLGRVEPLESLVDVADLHHRGGQQDEDERVRNRSREGPEERRRQHRRDALGGKRSVTAYKKLGQPI